MVKINDSTYVIIGTLALLVGGTLVFNIGPPENTFELISYWTGISLIVAGIFMDAGVVVKTNQKIRKLEDRVKKLEEKDM